jgi:hypothetical protein
MRKQYKPIKYSSKKSISLIGTISLLLLLFFFPFLTASFSRNKPSQVDFSPSNTALSTKAVLNNTNEKIVFTVTVICGGHVECNRGLQPLKKAINYLESELDLSFEIKNIILNREQPKGTVQERWQKWLNISYSLETYKTDLTVILLEAFPNNVNSFDFREESMIGLATGLGILGVVPATVFAKVIGSEQFTTRVLIHEIGHVLGGEHVEEGIMHPCACVNQYSDALSHFSLQQMKTHLEAIKFLRSIISKSTTPKPQTKNPEVKEAIVENWVCELQKFA